MTSIKISTRCYGKPGETEFTIESVRRMLDNLHRHNGFPLDSLVTMGRDDTGQWLEVADPAAVAECIARRAAR